MERVFKIEAFRNMGFKDGKPEATELLLNKSAKKGHLGNFLTVVGANNAGKSNVLSAMNIFASGEFSKKDITDLYMEDDCRTPALTLSVRTNRGKELYFCQKALGKAGTVGYPTENDSENSVVVASSSYDNFLLDLTTLCYLEEAYTLCKHTNNSYYGYSQRSTDFSDLSKKILSEINEILDKVDDNAKREISNAKINFKNAFDSATFDSRQKLLEVNTKINEYGETSSYNRREMVHVQPSILYDECFNFVEQEKRKAYLEYISVVSKYGNIPNEAYERWFNQASKILVDYKNEEKKYAQEVKKLSETQSNSYLSSSDQKNLADAKKQQNVYKNFFSALTERYKDTYKRFFPDLYATSVSDSAFATMANVFKKALSYNFSCKILTYEQKTISVGDLDTTSEAISTSGFFRALLHSIGVEVESIINAYQTFNLHKNKGYLNKLQTELNEKMKSVSDKFNALFMNGNVPYSFTIELERGGIFFYIYRGDQPLTLDLQSTGFRYFFDLFFNLLNTTTLESGDIIIMDEPALNLHVKGQRELREFLKEFAIRNDILIIIATHSPFLIDIDNLDDIRVVASDGAVSRIENNFTAVDPTDPDSLLPIKEALTVENHVLVNPKETVVFVQTMEEYCYLVAFKKLFEIKGISFLPVNFVSADKVQCEIALKRIREIRDDAFILVHDDDIGNTITDLCKESAFTVFTLSNIDESFTTVANLFADGEQLEGASTFKNFIHHEQDKVGENTKANFRKVFDWFKNES